MEDQGRHILVIHAITDGRTRYLTARKLYQLFREVSFSVWKSKLDSGGRTVVMRSDNQQELEPYKRSRMGTTLMGTTFTTAPLSAPGIHRRGQHRCNGERGTRPMVNVAPVRASFSYPIGACEHQRRSGLGSFRASRTECEHEGDRVSSGAAVSAGGSGVMGSPFRLDVGAVSISSYPVASSTVRPRLGTGGGVNVAFQEVVVSSGRDGHNGL